VPTTPHLASLVLIHQIWPAHFWDASAAYGHVTLLRGEFQPSKFFFQSDLQRWAN